MNNDNFLSFCFSPITTRLMMKLVSNLLPDKGNQTRGRIRGNMVRACNFYFAAEQLRDVRKKIFYDKPFATIPKDLFFALANVINFRLEH